MSNNTNTWNEVCTTWDTTCFNWAPCIAEVAEIIEGGARDPQEWHDPPFYEDQPIKKQTLIEIYIKCCEKKYKKLILLPEKKVTIHVSDVQFILKTLKEVGVDIKTIDKYNDRDLKRLLS